MIVLATEDGFLQICQLQPLEYSPPMICEEQDANQHNKGGTPVQFEVPVQQSTIDKEVWWTSRMAQRTKCNNELQQYTKRHKRPNRVFSGLRGVVRTPLSPPPPFSHEPCSMRVKTGAQIDN
jgi:hypothetical protein